HCVLEGYSTLAKISSAKLLISNIHFFYEHRIKTKQLVNSHYFLMRSVPQFIYIILLKTFIFMERSRASRQMRIYRSNSLSLKHLPKTHLFQAYGVKLQINQSLILLIITDIIYFRITWRVRHVNQYRIILSTIYGQAVKGYLIRAIRNIVSKPRNIHIHMLKIIYPCGILR